MTIKSINVEFRRGKPVSALVTYSNGEVFRETYIQPKSISDEDGEWNAFGIEFGGDRHTSPSHKVDVFAKATTEYPK